MKNLAHTILSGHHETMAFCQRVNDTTHEYYTYRPNVDLVASRNHYLHQVMNHRSHQSEY